MIAADFYPPGYSDHEAFLPDYEFLPITHTRHSTTHTPHTGDTDDMTWKKASEAGSVYDGSLPDDEKIALKLIKIEKVDNKFKPDEPRYQLTWECDDDHENMPLTTWASTRLGMKGTTIAAMRQIINAAEGRRRDEEIFALNDETLEYFLDAVEFDKNGEPDRDPDGQVKTGIKVLAMGSNTTEDKDGEKRTYFNVEKYLAAPKRAARKVADDDEPAREPVGAGGGKRARDAADF